MNKNTGIIVGVIAVIAIAVGIYFMNQTPSTDTSSTASNSTTTTSQNQTAIAPQGRVVMSVSDAATNMGAISDINMEVTSVALHSALNGWVTVSSTPHTFGLLTLNAKNESALLADINAAAGTYDQVRLTINSIAVKMKDGTVKTAKLPSDTLTINTTVVVNANNTASINFDFLASSSLHMTGNGSFIFAPVVKTESKSDTAVSIDTKNIVKITGGHSDDVNSEGMDLDGSVKANFQIKDSEKIDLNTDGSININGLLK